jgi:hypothetical protein
MTDNNINPWADSPEEQELASSSKGGESLQKIVSLKLPEGDTRVRIRGHYKFYYEHWFNKIKRTAVCPGKDCPACNHPDKKKFLDQARALRDAGKEDDSRELYKRVMATYAPRLRYAVNVLDRRDGVVKLWRFSRTIKETITKMADLNGDPNGYDIVITRKGLGKTTEYMVNATRQDTPLSEEETGLKLFSLASILKPTAVERVNSYLAGKLPEPRSSESKPVQSSEQLPTSSTPPDPTNFDLGDLDDIETI